MGKWALYFNKHTEKGIQEMGDDGAWRHTDEQKYSTLCVSSNKSPSKSYMACQIA